MHETARLDVPAAYRATSALPRAVKGLGLRYGNPVATIHRVPFAQEFVLHWSGFFIVVSEPEEAHVEEVGKILPSILGRHVNRGDSRLVEVLTALWPRAVGQGIAQHSRPVTFVSGTLTLATACPSWAAQLGQMSEEVRAEINSFLGRPVVRKLRVRHVPSLVLENGNSKFGSRKSETRNPRVETRWHQFEAGLRVGEPRS